jgi:hypothetical protein
VNEGLYLFSSSIDPYSGDVFHQPPLLLALFSLLPIQSIWFRALFWTGIDVSCGWLTGEIFERAEKVDLLSNNLSEREEVVEVRRNRVKDLKPNVIMM